jgi:hypothetical protein
MIAATIADAWKKETNKIVPKIIQVIHAASRIIAIKIQNGTIEAEKSGPEL